MKTEFNKLKPYFQKKFGNKSYNPFESLIQQYEKANAQDQISIMNKMKGIIIEGKYP